MILILTFYKLKIQFFYIKLYYMNYDQKYINNDVSFDFKHKKFTEDRSNFLINCKKQDYNLNGNETQSTKFNLSNQQLKGTIESSNLSNHFFSECNLNHIQQLIISNVAHLSNNKYKIGPQSREILLNLMKNIYLTHSNNTLCNSKIIKEVNRLNNILIDSIIPSLMSNITQYIGYLNKINNPIKIIDHSINVNKSGKQLEHPYLT